MTLPRLNRQSAGYWVAQAFDALDPFQDVAFDWTNIPLNFAARYGFVPDDAGYPIFQQVADGGFGATDGPVSGLICWPGINSLEADEDASLRVQAQWSWVFPVRIYSIDGGTFAIPQISGDGTGWTDDPTLAGQEVFTFDGSTPAVDTCGIVVMGTALDYQYLLFLPLGGGSGSGIELIPAVITADVDHAMGEYAWEEVDPLDNSILGGGRTGNAFERNRSEVIPYDGTEFVDIVTGGVYGAAYYFFYPLEDCPP